MVDFRTPSQEFGSPLAERESESTHTPCGSATTHLLLGGGSSSPFLACEHKYSEKLHKKAALAILSMQLTCLLYLIESCKAPLILKLHKLYLHHWKAWRFSSSTFYFSLDEITCQRQHWQLSKIKLLHTLTSPLQSWCSNTFGGKCIQREWYMYVYTSASRWLPTLLGRNNVAKI